MVGIGHRLWIGRGRRCSDGASGLCRMLANDAFAFLSKCIEAFWRLNTQKSHIKEVVIANDGLDKRDVESENAADDDKHHQ